MKLTPQLLFRLVLLLAVLATVLLLAWMKTISAETVTTLLVAVVGGAGLERAVDLVKARDDRKDEAPQTCPHCGSNVRADETVRE